MIHDVMAVVRKEWTEIFRQDEESRFSGFARLAILALLGLTFAQTLGPDFGTSAATPLISAFLAGLFILPTVADSFAGEREHHTLETLLASRISDRGLLMGKFMANVLYGAGASLAVTAVGLVLAVGRGGGLDALVLLAALGAALLAAMLATAVGVLVSLEFPTVKQATQALGLVFILVSAVPILLAEVVPEGWVAALGARAPTELTPHIVLLGFLQVAVLVMALLGVAHSRFRRSRLVGE